MARTAPTRANEYTMAAMSARARRPLMPSPSIESRGVRVSSRVRIGGTSDERRHLVEARSGNLTIVRNRLHRSTFRTHSTWNEPVSCRTKSRPYPIGRRHLAQGVKAPQRRAAQLRWRRLQGVLVVD